MGAEGGGRSWEGSWQACACVTVLGEKRLHTSHAEPEDGH